MSYVQIKVLILMNQLYFFSTNILMADKLRVVGMLGMNFSSNSEQYLGLPNIVGRGTKAAFQNLKDRIRQRIEG